MKATTFAELELRYGHVVAAYLVTEIEKAWGIPSNDNLLDLEERMARALRAEKNH